MSELKIDIQRTGFPVKIGTIELWFDSSLENLRKFFNVDQIAQEKLRNAEEKAKHIHFPTDADETNVDDIDVETVDAAFDVNKEFIAAQYDIVFGDGTFKKVYKVYPDILALEQTLDVVGNAIAKRIEELEEERTEIVNAKKDEYLKRKKQKRK